MGMFENSRDNISETGKEEVSKKLMDLFPKVAQLDEE